MMTDEPTLEPTLDPTENPTETTLSPTESPVVVDNSGAVYYEVMAGLVVVMVNML